MKQALLLLLSCFLSASVSAQSLNVKGKLVSAGDHAALPYATISIASESLPGTPVKKLATDGAGQFSTTLPAGKYIFSFQFVGMNTLEQNIEVPSGRNPLDLGEIVMDEGSTELEEVSVTAQRPLVKVEIDKLTYSAKDDPEATTSTVLDMLRKVPLVTVDGEDNIQLKGSSNFKIYLNGKPSNMISNNPSQVLKSMPANSIKDIEVITDPGAKYDAEGVGGIINIITDKRVDDGYSGSVGANADTNGMYGGNAYLNTKYGKFGFSGNMFFYRQNNPESTSTFEREDFEPNAVNYLLQDGTVKNNGHGLYLTGSLSYEPDTVNLFNLSVSRYGGKFKSRSNSHAESEGAQNYAYDMLSNSVGQYGGLNFSADYQRSFKKKGEMLTVSYRFEHNPDDSEFENIYEDVTGDYFYPEGYRMKSINDAGGKEHTSQIDYVNPLTDSHSLEVGLKYIFRDNSSLGTHTFYDAEDGTWKDNPGRKNDLDHQQNIASGYAGYGFKKAKFGIKAGLRGEYTKQEVDFRSLKDTTIHTDFFDLVPSFTVSYQLGMTKTLRVGYNMRISRPGIWYLNPYRDDANPISIRYGNPELDAEQTHNFNVNYGSFAQKVNFNVTLSYGFTRNAITSYSFVQEGVTHNTYGNIGKNQSVGLNLYSSWTPSEKLRLYVNTSGNYTDIQSTENADIRNSGFSGQAFAGGTYSFGKDFRFGANSGVFSNRIQLQTTQSPYYFYSFSLMKSFFDKKLDVNLSANNVFGKYIKFKTTTEGEGFTQKSLYNYPARAVRLSITYRFGDLKTSIKKVQRGITNEDVKAGESSQSGGGAPAGGGS